MSSSDSKEDVPESEEDDPADILDYDECGFGTSLFQDACKEYAAKQIPGEFDQNGSTYGLRGEVHVAIALLYPDEVSTEFAEGIPEEATFVGILLHPQGFGNICYVLEDGEVSWSEPDLFLRHPAELADVRHMLTRRRFPVSRTRKSLDWSLDADDRKELMRQRGEEKFWTIMYGVQEFDRPLEVQYHKRTFSLSELVSNVFLLIEEEPFKGFLLPLDVLHEDAAGKELLAESNYAEADDDSTIPDFPFGTLSTNHWSNDDFVVRQWKGDFAKFQQRLVKFAKTRQDRLSPVSHEDVVIGYDGTLTSPQTLGMLRDNSQAGPKLVARLNPETVSLMRFLDHAAFTFELPHIIQSAGKAKTWKDASKREKIKLESDPLDQVRSAISFRHELRDYDSNVRYDAFFSRFSRFSDPEKLALSLDERERRYQVLTDIQDAFHVEEEGYRDYLSPPPPELPHFLEIAYRRFQETQTFSERLTQSLELYNLLGRSLLFLMLEDIRSIGIQSEKIASIEKKIRAPRVSENTWINFQKELINIIGKLGDSVREEGKWLVTKPLTEILPDLLQTHMGPLGEARNRFAHSPYDDRGFLREAEQQIPPFISKLREGFRNIEILMPENFETDHDNDLIVNARSLMGDRFEYPLRKIINLCPGSYKDMPTKELLVCRIHFQSGSENIADTPISERGAEFYRQDKDAITSLLEWKDDPARIALGEKLEKWYDEKGINRKDAEALGNAYANEFVKTRTPRVFRAAPLNLLFNAKTGYKEMLMTGIFKGMEKGQPSYQYVEDGDIGVMGQEG